MLNDRLQDELLALQSIYPEDTISWTERTDGHVDLSVTLKVDLEQPHAVRIYNYVETSKPSESKSSATPQPSTSRGAGDGLGQRKQSDRNPREAKGKGSKAFEGSRLNRPSPATSSFVPRAAPRSNERSTRAPAVSSPPTSPPTPPPPVTIAAPTPSPLSNSKTPRIKIVQRPPTPPPLVQTLPQAIEKLTFDPLLPVELSLGYLPPLHLSIELPPAYPETSGPSRIELKAEGNWLSELNRRAALEKLNEVYMGEECLFGITQLLSSSSPDFLPTLSLSTPIVLRQSDPSSLSCSTLPLSDLLTAYNRSASSSAFDTSSHLCPLCFAPRKGSNCLRLDSCGCTFCIPCLRDYFSLLITEGMVRSVACPAIECVGKRSKWEKSMVGNVSAEAEAQKPGRVTGDEVEKLCGAESRKRFEWLQEKIRVESDPSISFCPRESCQTATPKLDEDKLRICPSCQFAYCVFCRKGWHGTRNPCSLPQSNAIVSQYMAADDNEKRTLEQRYGAANLKRLVTAFEEERALQEWLEQHATRCPGCSVPIEKSHGCNHVTCAKCGTHLCYRCGKSISPTEPYKHYNTPSSICFGRLFDFSPGQEPAVEEWIGELLAEDDG